MNSNDAADQVVSMSLKGIEMVARITGAGAKNLATYLYAVLRDQKKTKGKTRLEGMLRSGKELKVFSVKNGDLKKFTMEANRYGVLYCVLRDKKSIDGMCDIMVRVEDASKISRIVERFKLAAVDTAAIRQEILTSKASRAKASEEKGPAEKGTPAEKNADDFLDELMASRPEPEAPRADNPNPTMAATEKSLPSEPISERSGSSAEGMSEPKRKSVRQELREIVKARGKKAEPKRTPAREKRKSEKQATPSAQPKAPSKRKKKER